MAEQVKKETVAQPEVPNITAGDVATVVRIIDAGSQRGAWRGEELATIGALREKFAAVVKALAPATPDVQNEAVEETKQTDEVGTVNQA